MKAETKTKTAIVETPEEEGQKKGKVEKKSGKRVGYYYIIVKSLKENSKNDVVKCLYIKSLTNFGFCVIKEGTLGDTKDRHGRDIRDRLIWQKELHQKLHGKMRIPKYLGDFEENGNYYLVIEHMKGRSLGHMIKKGGMELRDSLIAGKKKGIQFLNILLKVIELIEKLHNEGVVHRDATGGNFMVTRRGKVGLIDMELSYSLEKELPDPPFELGTAGFMSPQQEQTQKPTIHDDIFSIGAIILFIWTGISPSKITRPPADELEERIRFYISDKQLADLTIKCLQVDPKLRPDIVEIKQAIHKLKNDFQKKVIRPQLTTRFKSKAEILNIINKGISSICSPLMSDKEKGWYAQNQQSIKEDKHKIEKAYYGSMQYGVAGPMYLMSRAASIGLDVSASSRNIEKGLQLIETKYLITQRSSMPSLYYGSAGVALSIASVVQSMKMADPKYYSYVEQLLERKNNEYTLLNGRAGNGIAKLYCSAFVHGWDVNQSLSDDADFLCSLQKKDGSWSAIMRKNKEIVIPTILGGLSGPLYFLLEYKKRFGDNQHMNEVEKGLNWLIKHAIRESGKIFWKSIKGRKLNYGWCEGISGIAMLFLKAWEVTGQVIYKSYAEGALKGIDPLLMDWNLSQCHGLSGLGEVYLEAYRCLRDEYWLKRADWIAQLIYQMRFEHPQHGTYWLVEAEKIPTAGFMIGNSGVVHFLMSYCFPENSTFPLLHTSDQTTPDRILKPIATNFIQA